MKNLIIILALAFSGFISAQEINWMSLEEAVIMQKKSPKKIMMDVYTNWCGPCKLLDKNTFKNKDVAAYVNKHYYAVKFNGEGNEVINFNGSEYKNASYNPDLANRRNSAHDLVRYFKVNAYPTMVFIDEQGGFIFPLRGYKTPQELELYLKMFKNDDHKDMKTQEAFNDYYSAFKPEFVQK
jgi:thioredoxin-related protein